MADEVEMTPISPEEGGGIPPKVAPFAEKPAAPAAPAPAAAAPATPPAPAAAPAVAAAPAAAASGSPTIKLKPVIRRPMIRKPTIGGPKPLVPGAAAPAAPAASPAQNLKSATGPIPAQATLRKTGIIAEGIITPAQQQAAKSKTSRISLESAIGVAPAKESPAPMKTIKLRRPAELKPTLLSTSVPSSIGDAPTINPAAAPAEQASGEPGPGETQKKTLKLRKPGGPSIGLKKPPTLGVKSDQPAPAPADSAIADIPDLPAGGLAPLAPVPQKDQCAGVPSWVAVMSLVTTLAALLVIGAVAYFLYLEGCGPDAGANAMPFIQTEA